MTLGRGGRKEIQAWERIIAVSGHCESARAWRKGFMFARE